jgi:eukaryotic-like serine/threonine-protein kinase
MATVKGDSRFHLTRLLGEGGFGIVYEAFDRDRNAVVALKKLRRFDPAALYRFKQEFRALADIDHPNVVSLYELLSEGDEWFLTMELIDGVPFVDCVRDRTRAAPLDVDRLRQILVQVADALGAIHRIGVLHRDIKPSNVLVTAEPRAVLLDFGLVTELGKLDEPETFGRFGSPLYMSPEDSAGLPISEASDWYSVGVMLYEALTGQRPFRGTGLEVLAQKQRAEAPSPKLLAPHVPADLNQLCEELLRRDPAARPSGTQVLERLGQSRQARRGGPSLITSKAGPTRLIGRERHLRALADAYDHASAGAAVTVCVQGPSGIGKTALVKQFLHGLRDHEREPVILTGRCYHQESVPYKAVDGIIDSLAQYLMGLTAVEAARLLPRDMAALVRLFPALRDVDPLPAIRSRITETGDSLELRRHAFAALRELLGALADQSPLVLFIDDLQWGDLDSASLLTELLRPPDPPALLLIASYRSEERDESPLLRELLPVLEASGPGLDSRTIAVGELLPSEACDLARALLSVKPGADAYVDAIARQSDGSPFFVEELVRYALDSGEVVPLEQVLQSRVAALPLAARHLLELVSVTGQPLDFAIAAAASQSELGVATVHQLRAQRLIRVHGASDPPALEMYHDRIREAVVGALPSDRLRQHHFRLAAAWEASGRRNLDPERIAHHYQSAGYAERAFEHAKRAATLADAALAFDRAARLYRLTIELARPDASDRQELLVKLGDALANAGRGLEAARAYENAASHAEEAGTADGEAAEVNAHELHRRAAYYYSASGHVDEGNIAFRNVLTHVDMHLPETPIAKIAGLLAVRARLRVRGLRVTLRDTATISRRALERIDAAWAVGTGLGLIDLGTGWLFTSQSLLLALQAGEPFRIARALAWDAATSASMSLSGNRRARLMLDRCASLAQILDQPYSNAMLAMAKGLAAYSSGEWLHARELLAEAADIFINRCTGTSWELSTLRGFQLRNLLILGRLEELRSRAREALQRAEDTGDLYYVTYHGVFIEPHLRLFDDDDAAAARQSVTSALARWSTQGYHIQHALAAEAIPAIELYSGNPAAAVDTIRHQWPLMQKNFLLRNLVFRRGVLELRARAAISAAAADEPRRAELLTAAERDLRALEHLGQPCLAPYIQLLYGGIARIRGNSARARELLVGAAEGFAERGLEGLAAATNWSLGMLGGTPDAQNRRNAADAWMRAERVKNPARFTAMLVPGFPAPVEV